MSKLDTIPAAEEGATLLPKPRSTGIRRVVAVAAVAASLIGVLAATAVHTSPGRHASNLHKHKYWTTLVDDEGPHKHYWDDDDFNPDDVDHEACEQACKTDADCAAATRWVDYNTCGSCQNWGEDPTMECSEYARPAAPPNTPSRTIKNAQIRLRSDPTKCLTFVPDSKDLSYSSVLDKIIVDKCGGGDGGGHRLSLQQFTYTYEPGNDKINGKGRIMYDHDITKKKEGNRCLSAGVRYCYAGCEVILWGCDGVYQDCKTDQCQGNLYYDGNTIKVYDRGWWKGNHHHDEQLCMTVHKGKNIRMEECKGKDGDKTQQWQIGDDA